MHGNRVGCIHPGDRILRINQQCTGGLHLDEAVSLLKDSKPRVTLDVQFDVADSVVAACGVFWVKLVKRGISYGITLSCTQYLEIIHNSSYFGYCNLSELKIEFLFLNF